MQIPAINIHNAIIWIHLVAGFILIGGLAFMQFLVEPLLRKGGEAAKEVLWRRLTKSFLILAWISFLIVGLTGVWNTVFNPNAYPAVTLSSITKQSPAETWKAIESTKNTPYGTALVIKHVFILGMLFSAGWATLLWRRAIKEGQATSRQTISRFYLLNGFNLAFGVLVLLSTALMVYTFH